MAYVGVTAGVAVFVGVGVLLGRARVGVDGIAVSVGVYVGETGTGLNVEVGDAVAAGAHEENVNNAPRSSAKKIHLNFIQSYQCVCKAASIIC